MSLIISANADAVLAVARSQAIRLGHEFISCDHVLLAILISNLGGFVPWLESQGLTLNGLELRLLAIPRPEPRAHYGLVLSPKLSEILGEIVYRPMHQTGFPDEPKITTRRILRGLLGRVRECWPDGLPCQVMIAAGKTLQDLDGSIADLTAMEDADVREKVARGPAKLDTKEI